MNHLSQYACTPCPAGTPPASPEETAALHAMVPSWRIVREQGTRKLLSDFRFDSSQELDRFLLRVQEHADREDHQPEFRRGKPLEVEIAWWTPEIGDIHPNDFIMAARTDAAFMATLVGHEGMMSTGRQLPTLAEAPFYRRVLAWRALVAAPG